MSISTYSELQTAVSNFLGRSDLSSRIPEFIQLCEGEANRILYHYTQEKRATATTAAGDESIAVPSDVRSVRAIKVDSSPNRVLRHMTPEALWETYSSESQGMPEAFFTNGCEFIFRPIPDAEYTLEIVYFVGVPELSNTNTENGLLTRHPDVYLYGSLYHAYTYLLDEQRAALYKAKFYEALEQVRVEAQHSRFAGGLRMKAL